MRSDYRARTVLALGSASTHHACAEPARTGLVIAAAAVAALALSASKAFADVSPTVTVGAGLRTSFDVTSPSEGDKVEDFNLDSIRLYVSGSVTDQIGFMFNTEYNGGTNAVGVLDAAAQFHFSDQLNIWAGRFLPPSDRANMYGPYYANQWGVYNDGVQDGYPSTATGRDNGIMYWGQFGMLKASAGAFDIPSTVGTSDKVYAARLQLDLWDPENGYYLNGTYYGDKDLLALGVAAQSSDAKKAFSADFLLEKKLPNAGVVSFESEFARYQNFGGYSADAQTSHGWYGLASYLFPTVVGIGKFEVLAKYAEAKYDLLPDFETVDDTQKTKDFELNYVIKQFNARVSLYYIDFTYDHQIVAPNHKQYGIGVQLQM
jgi:hypothetical protein